MVVDATPDLSYMSGRSVELGDSSESVPLTADVSGVSAGLASSEAAAGASPVSTAAMLSVSGLISPGACAPVLAFVAASALSACDFGPAASESGSTDNSDVMGPPAAASDTVAAEVAATLPGLSSAPSAARFMVVVAPGWRPLAAFLRAALLVEAPARAPTAGLVGAVPLESVAAGAASSFSVPVVPVPAVAGAVRACTAVSPAADVCFGGAVFAAGGAELAAPTAEAAPLGEVAALGAETDPPGEIAAAGAEG